MEPDRLPFMKASTPDRLSEFWSCRKAVEAAQHRVDGHTGQNDTDGVHAVAPCHEVDQHTGQRRASKSKQRQRAGHLWKHQQNQNGCGAGACGHTDGAGICQRILHNRLQQDAGYGKTDAHDDGDQRPGNSQALDDDGIGALRITKEDINDLGKGDAGAAHCHGNQEHHAQSGDQNAPYQTELQQTVARPVSIQFISCHIIHQRRLR